MNNLSNEELSEKLENLERMILQLHMIAQLHSPSEQWKRERRSERANGKRRRNGDQVLTIFDEMGEAVTDEKRKERILTT